MERAPVKDRAKSVANQPPLNAAQPKALASGKTRATAKGIGGQQLQKTREALLSESEISWDSSSPEDVRRHLYMKGYSHDDTASFDTLESIALVLLRIAAEATSVVTADACRAVAILLELRNVDKEICDMSEGIKRILEWTTTANKPTLAWGDRDENDEEYVALMPTDLNTAAEALTQTVEQQCKDIWRLTEQLEKEVTEVVTRVEEAVEATRGATQAADAWASGHAVPPVQTNDARASGRMVAPTTSTVQTYATAAAASHPPERAAALANAAARSCQIMLKRAPDTDQWLVGITEKDMLQKARIAMELMTSNNGGASPPPRGSTFVGATLQRSGAWVLHTNTTAAAAWIKTEMNSFLAAMGGTSSFKDRFLNVLVQFVPISFDPAQESSLRAIESDNSLPKGVIAKAHWVKPVHRRQEGQRVAHAIFGFSDAKAANVFIRDGAWVEGRKVNGRKLLNEPIRCLKCQGLNTGHIAAKCPSDHEVCARCGEAHRTDTCNATNDQRACVNCRRDHKPHRGHGAADRVCPIFQDKLQYSLERNREAKYPYFLIEDAPDTWSTHEEIGAALGNTRDRPDWREGQARRGERGPGPSAQVAGSICAQMTQTQHTGRQLFQPTLEETIARAKTATHQETALDPRMHPSRAALIANTNEQQQTTTAGTGQAQRTPSPPAEQWTADDEAALREIEEEEAAIAAQTAILAKRKAKWKAKRPVGPITVTFHDDGAEYTSKPDQATKRSSLPPLSDDEDDIEIERTLAPGVRSSPYSVDDRNA